jgi:LPXTG-motif cell wall-anchored protein
MQLYKDGAAFGPPATLSSANGWAYAWEGMERGPVWTVNEINVPAGYSKAVTGDAANGFIVTNTKTAHPPAAPTNPPGVPGGEITLSGRKTWNHGDNPAASRPNAITVIVKADGVIVAQRLITAAEHWAWAFRLPERNADGRTIVYTVDEARFEDYVKTVDGYNLINTYMPGGRTGEVPPPYTVQPGGSAPQTGDEENAFARWLAFTLLSFAALVLSLLPWHRVARGAARRRA